MAAYSNRHVCSLGFPGQAPEAPWGSLSQVSPKVVVKVLARLPWGGSAFRLTHVGAVASEDLTWLLAGLTTLPAVGQRHCCHRAAGTGLLAADFPQSE